MDPTGVNQVLINGQPATSDEVNWTYTATLVPGQNELVISEETADGVNEIDRIFVDRSPNLITPAAIVEDNTNGRFLILDPSQNLLIAADKESGALTTLSPPSGEPNLIQRSLGLALDAARNRVLIYQKKQNEEDTNPEMLAIDLTSGAQSIFDVPDFTDIELAHSPRALIVANNTAYVADSGTKYFDLNGNEVAKDSAGAIPVNMQFIYQINLSTGTRVAISHWEALKEQNGARYGVYSLAYNPTKSVLYAMEIANTVSRVVEVNLADGKQKQLTFKDKDNNTFSLRQAYKIDIDVPGQRLFLLNDTAVGGLFDPTVLSIDIQTNVGKILSSNAVPKDGKYVLRNARGMHYSPTDDAIYLVEDGQDAIFKIAAETGERTLVTSTGPVDENGYITNSLIKNLILAGDHQTYILDLQYSSVYGYNLYFGSKDIINNSVTNGVDASKEVLRSPTSGVWNPSTKQLLLANEVNAVLSTYDPATRKADARIGLPAVPSDLQINSAFDTVYAAFTTGVAKVDLTDYRITFLSTPSIPDRRNSFQGLRGIVLDEEHNRLLGVDSTVNAVLAVDLTTGTRTLFSPPSATPDAEDILLLPRAIALDKPNNRALVLDTGRKAIVGVDLTTGERADVYRYADVSPRVIWTPSKMVFHPTFNYLLLLDEFSGTLGALDLNGDTPQFVTLTR